MRRPAHGPWCGGRARPWSCRYCKRKIFWYTCNHGSVRPFDELGHPWPVHDCEERRLARGESRSDGRFGKASTPRLSPPAYCRHMRARLRHRGLGGARRHGSQILELPCSGDIKPSVCPDCRIVVLRYRCGGGCDMKFDDESPPWCLHDCGKPLLDRRAAKRRASRFGALDRQPPVPGTGSSDSRPGPAIPTGLRFAPSSQHGLGLKGNSRGKEDRNDARKNGDDGGPGKNAKTDRRKSRRRPAGDELRLQPALNQRKTVEGIVYEVQAKRNVHRAFRLPDTTMGLAMLGALGQGAMGELTLHLRQTNGDRQKSEVVTAWGRSGLLRGLSRGSAVRIQVHSERIHGKVVWMLESVSAISAKG